MKNTKKYLFLGSGFLAVYLIMLVIIKMNYLASPVPGMDLPIMDFAFHMRNTLATTIFSIDAKLFGDATGAVLALVVAAFLYFIPKEKMGAIWLLSSVGVTIVLNTLVKSIIGRPRPMIHRMSAFINESGKSFASGHSVFATVLFGVLFLILLQRLNRTGVKVIWGIFFFLVIVSIMFSRIYIGVHYPSDTIAGFLFGSSWLAFTYPIFVQHKDWGNYQTKH
ncbi:MAG: phosphatase PAP2 family protein [Streptococcaceae bacterium]|jgi:undecaprenyl-diphosphatase|nr:phosphatase PAP2 family protein [Streptococcaceae bacterium]